MRKTKILAKSSLLGAALALLLLAVMPGCVGSADGSPYRGEEWDYETYYDEIEEEWDAFYDDDYYGYKQDPKTGVADDEAVADWTDGEEYWRLYAIDEIENDNQCMCRLDDDYYRDMEESAVCRYEDGQFGEDKSA